MRKALIALALVAMVAGPALAGGKPSVCTRGIPRIYRQFVRVGSEGFMGDTW